MNAESIRTIGIVGCGTMGAGIAQVAAANGFDVILLDVSEDRLRGAAAGISQRFDREIAKNRITSSDKDAALGRIHLATDMNEIRRSDFVIEAVSEVPETKFALFETLDALARPGVILASNTSSISIAEIGKRTARPDRVIGMHFMNPVPVMTLVEIVRGPSTAESTCEMTTMLAAALGKTPVQVNDSPGFVSNRVLMPMINEAVYCVMEGVGTPEAVDTIMKLGMNHPLGPLALADLIGLDVCVDIMEILEKGFGNSKYGPCPLLRQMVEAGRLGRKSGQGFYKY